MNASLKEMELRVIDHTGDSKTIWNPDNQDEVDAAKATFDALKKKNYIAYTVKANGKKNEIIHSFDPELGKIIMVPPMVGG